LWEGVFLLVKKAIRHSIDKKRKTRHSFI